MAISQTVFNIHLSSGDKPKSKCRMRHLAREGQDAFLLPQPLPQGVEVLTLCGQKFPAADIDGCVRFDRADKGGPVCCNCINVFDIREG